jgi:hypothetical protein
MGSAEEYFQHLMWCGLYVSLLMSRRCEFTTARLGGRRIHLFRLGGAAICGKLSDDRIVRAEVRCNTENLTSDNVLI